MHKIIISLTTISSRLSHIHLVIESLLSQDFPPDAYEVRLHLSEQPYLLDEGCPMITNDLSRLQEENPEQFFVKFVENIGSYRKIIPVLDEVYKQSPTEFCNTLIVTADDDTAYPPWWLWQLYENYLKHRCVIGFRGRVMGFEKEKLISYKKWSRKITDNPSSFNVPTGKDGVLYSPLYLHPKVRDINEAQKSAPKADDLWLKAHTLLAGVPSFVINDTLNQEFPSVTGQEPEVSLYRTFNEFGGNDDALANIENYLKATRGTSFRELCIPSQMNTTHLCKEIANILGGVS
ncbi:MAG: glycosyltransferase family 2 protein [Okeania sp. SIO2F4]|uniref:glycosyltransferase family A protein n=1 Tax=Okeania sp. SIO2F4 TaxID=2607790 RepID=UPI0014291489|nr:glycosyltransferase family A protein [Okeania sp. SIO2F4]NES03745.1 glycosyltransferase family 2 protein [Okeania sp. SIO2F4]